MEPITFNTKPAFTVVGVKIRHNGNDPSDVSKKQIPGLWHTFIPRMDEIKHKATPPTSYGLMDNFDRTAGEFDYTAAFEVTSTDDIPDGMFHKSVPEGYYAVFTSTLGTLGPSFHAIYKQWLPNADYVRAEGPEFELYPPDFAGRDDSPVYIYIPVQKK